MIFSVSLVPKVNSSDKMIELFQRRVAINAEEALGSMSWLPEPHAIRCVFWHPAKTLGDRSWHGRSRLHDAVIRGTCRGIQLPEHLVTGVLFSWVPSPEQPHVLVDIQRLQWTNEIIVPKTT